MENIFRSNFYSETSSDEFPSDSSDYDSDDHHGELKKSKQYPPLKSGDVGLEPHENINLYRKLLNRERTGHFSGNSRCVHQQRAFNKVPSRLGFCLKDIVPYCYLQGHMFMGLSACGQFLLSYKVCCNDNAAPNDYYFNIGYKYTLYFWIYRPHQPLQQFFKRCLFDDHGVDNLKSVTMTQWRRSPQVLIVHGAAENENEDSYITYVKVPKLGCLDCKKLWEFDEDGFYRTDALCLKCNLTIHTKYSTNESDPKFNSHINLICPERIIIIANGFIHMLNIDLDTLPAHHLQLQQQHHHQISGLSHLQYVVGDATASAKSTPPHEPAVTADRRQQQQIAAAARAAASKLSVPEESLGCDNKNNIVARIIADFSDIETDAGATSRANEKSTQRSNESNLTRKNFDELIFTCAGINSGAGYSNAGSSQSSSSAAGGVTAGTIAQTKVDLVNHQGKRNHRIVTKSYRNGVRTVDMQGGTSTSAKTSSVDKASAYEFSEDNEKCEKIGIFRKRRLADKKYEFSEDNLENIIPFRKIRPASAQHNTKSSAVAVWPSGTAISRIHRTTSHFHHSPCVSPSSSSHTSASTASALMFGSIGVSASSPHRSSPIQGFRSPPVTCDSPVSAGSNGVTRSPGKYSSAQFYHQKSPPPLSQATQQMLSFKPLTTLSPLHISMTKRNHYEIGGNMSPTAVPFLSPRREEHKVFEVPLNGGFGQEKPMCTKKFKRRYVEEDDAASVITSEEDDCISPGYHTSLPMEVHGSCYSDMQMISQTTYQRLRCASVVVTQHSFDLETFTYYVISILCQKNNKTYDVFYDWACELINVCPRSNLISCVLMAQFTARDQLPVATKNCLNCSRNIDCVFHRKQFECRILFTWNMETGEWDVIDYGELNEFSCQSYEGSGAKKFGGDTLTQTAKCLAQQLASNLNKLEDFSPNLRVLDSNVSKSKTSLVDLDNTIEFYLKRARYSQ